MVMWLAKIAGIAVLYVATGRLGFSMAIAPGNITAVWPPSGVSLAAVLRWGPRVWPGIWAGSFLINLWFFSQLELAGVVSVLVASCIALGSSLQALLGGTLITRLIGTELLFSRTQDVFKFALSMMVACLVAPSIGVTSLCAAGLSSWSSYMYMWATWWLGDLTGALVVAPVFLVWHTFKAPVWTRWRAAEGLALLASVALVSQAVFGGNVLGSSNSPVGFLLLPFLVWAACRFGQAGVMTSALIMSAIALWGTTHGFGPFALLTMHESLLVLQAFVGIMSLTGLALAAAVAEQQRAQQELRQAHAQLEQRVAQRTQELRALNDSLQQEVAGRKRLEREILSISEREQQRIGQDLHDGLCQQLTGIALMGRALAQRLAAVSPTAAKEVGQLADLVNQAILKTRDLVRGLYPATLSDGDLNTALHELASSTELLTSTACRVSVHTPLMIRDHDIALHLYRIAQEALQNAIKHGKAKQVHIELRGQPDAGGLTLVVRDNGVGLQEAPDRRQGARHGMGLSIMRHRASLIGASLEIQRNPTEGTAVVCALRHASAFELVHAELFPSEPSVQPSHNEIVVS